LALIADLVGTDDVGHFLNERGWQVRKTRGVAQQRRLLPRDWEGRGAHLSSGTTTFVGLPPTRVGVEMARAKPAKS
jgi:hypothetical protein